MRQEILNFIKDKHSETKLETISYIYTLNDIERLPNDLSNDEIDAVEKKLIEIAIGGLKYLYKKGASSNGDMLLKDKQSIRMAALRRNAIIDKQLSKLEGGKPYRTANTKIAIALSDEIEERTVLQYAEEEESLYLQFLGVAFLTDFTEVD
mgnify:FL=1